MPLLGALLTTLFGGIATWFVSILGRKLAVAAAGIGALATITGALMLAMRSVVNPLLASMFSTQYGQFLGLAFPPVAGTCIAAIATTWAACALYKWQRAAVNIGVQA